MDILELHRLKKVCLQQAKVYQYQIDLQNKDSEFYRDVAKDRLNKTTTKVIKIEDDLVGKIDVVECCKIGPITNENYCPKCGKEILK